MAGQRRSAASPIRLTPYSPDRLVPNATMDHLARRAAARIDVLQRLSTKRCAIRTWANSARPDSRGRLSLRKEISTRSLHFRRTHIRGLLIVRVNCAVFFRIEGAAFAVHLLGRHGEHETIGVGTEAGRVVPAVGGARHALGEGPGPRQRF